MPTAAHRATGPTLTERLDQGFGFLLRKSHRAFLRALARELGAHGVSTAEWSVLRVLWHRQAISQVDLAEQVGVQRSSLTALLDGLERRGLLLRTRDAQDRRKILLYLTAPGRALEAKLLPCGLAANARAVRGLSPSEIDAARRLLERLVANLED